MGHDSDVIAEALGVALLRSALVVIAHPDDESFGLGAVLARLAAEGVALRVLCLTHGEASTLGGDEDLATVRPRELACAAGHLEVRDVTLLDHPDGSLALLPTSELERVVDAHVGDADALIAFEPGGVTGHPDHRAATLVAERIAARRGLPVVEWGVSPEVAQALNAEFGTSFVGFDGQDLEVDRTRQWQAIRCHHSQSNDNPVLRRRLDLQGDVDRLRVIS